MNEIAKCPICGGVPLDKWEVTSVRVFQTGQTCCGVDCNTNERWNQYAAAMKAEARHNALVEAVMWLLDAQSVVDENITCPNWRRHVGISDVVRQARAEVGRLIANKSAADCKGEE